MNHLKQNDDSAITEKQQFRYATCHSFLLFHRYPELKRTKLAHALHCDLHLLCPMCAIRRAARQVKNYEERTAELLRENPKLKLYYVVLTIKNQEDLSSAYEHLTTSVGTLTRRRREALKYKNTGAKRFAYAAKSVFASTTAGAYSIEVKRGNNSKQWHPHVNFILLSETAIDKKKLVEEWREITQDSYITHCEEQRQSSTKDALVEVFKYALKFSEMSFEDNLFSYRTLRGKRLLGSFGEYRGLELSEEEEDLSLYEYEELFYKYNRQKEHYERASSEALFTNSKKGRQR